jgi:uncharacterized membrane protein
LRLGAYAILLLTLLGGWLANRKSLLPSIAVAAMVFLIPWLNVVKADGFRWRNTEPSVAMYAVVAATCVFLAWWGVREASRAVVNFGIAAFALTVMWFYFSDVMGKLDRSLGLIVLGVLFLAGGWALEKMRRRMVASIAEVSA